MLVFCFWNHVNFFKHYFFWGRASRDLLPIWRNFVRDVHQLCSLIASDRLVRFTLYTRSSLISAPKVDLPNLPDFHIVVSSCETEFLQGAFARASEQTKSHSRHNVTRQDFPSGTGGRGPSHLLDQLEIPKVGIGSCLEWIPRWFWGGRVWAQGTALSKIQSNPPGFRRYQPEQTQKDKTRKGRKTTPKARRRNFFRPCGRRFFKYATKDLGNFWLFFGNFGFWLDFSGS